MSYQKFYSNQIHSSSLLCQLSQMWKDQILCDALIRTGPITTKAHRLVLIAACPMLQSMENAAAGSHLEVRLAADIKQDAVNTFLQYLYEGFMMLTEENCRDVEKVARLLQVDGVIKCCADFYKCYQNKTGIVMQHGGQHKYSFQDLIEFRHVRSSDIIKSANERMMKRTSEFSRPGSPGGKRQRLHHAGSPHTEGPSHRSAEDVVSMSDSYRGHHSDIWERVPRTGASKGATGRSSQPGVIDIVEDSIEIVQTDTVEKDPSRPLEQQRQTGQRSVAISIASQITDNDLRIVNITGGGGTKDGTGSRTNMSTTSTTNSTRGQISSLSSQHESFQHSSPQSVSSPSSMHSSSPRVSDRMPSVTRQHELQQRAQDFNLPNLGSDIELVPVPKPIPRLPQEGPSSGGPSPRQQPFPISLSPVGYPSQTSVPPKSFSAGSLQFPSAAAGSANQVMGSPHSVPSPGTRGPRSHSVGNQGRSDSTERASPANEGGKEQSFKDRGDSSSSSTADLTPDLSIVKVEKSAVKDDDTVGLDMYVDMADNSTMVLQQAQPGDEEGDKSDDEHDEALEEWAREEMANEGSSIGDQSSMHGSFKGVSHIRTVANEAVYQLELCTPGNQNTPQYYNKGGYMQVDGLINRRLQQSAVVNISPHSSGFFPGAFGYRNEVPTARETADEKINLELAGYQRSVGPEPQHRLIRNTGTKYKTCVFCQLKKVKTKSGWYAYTYYKCEACDVSLCKGKRDCFREYHKAFCVNVTMSPQRSDSNVKRQSITDDAVNHDNKQIM